MSPRNNRCQNGAPKSRPNSVPAVTLVSLTPPELEVARWIAEAKRNHEIAAILECSPRTVQKHVQNILEDLGLENRTAICRWWFEQQGFAERPRAGKSK